MHGNFLDDPLLQGDDDVPDNQKIRRTVLPLRQQRTGCDINEGSREADGPLPSASLGSPQGRAEKG